MTLRLLSLWIITLQLSSTAFADPGFLKVDSPLIPQPVKAASNSVFKIYSQAGRYSKNLNMADVQAVAEVKAKIKSEDNWWENLQLQYCERLNAQSCPLFSQMGEGSTFLAGNQTTLYSNLHNFVEVLSAQVKTTGASNPFDIFKTLNQSPLFMGIADRDQKPVFNPATETARLNFFNPNLALFDQNRNAMVSFLGRLSDIVKIQTTSAINAQPLTVSTTKPKPGDTLYLIGFPSETTDRAAMGVQDSDGRGLFVTVGKVMTTQTWMEKTQNTMSPKSKWLYDKHMIFVDFDCEHGNSGGPIVNGNGEVVGIMMGMWIDVTNHPKTRICGGLNTIDTTELRNLWQALAN